MNSDLPVLVDLGCGQSKIDRAGFRVIGVDVWSKSNADLIAPAHDMPFENESVSAIHARHLMEHFDYDGLVAVIRECYRVLAPGGELEIISPHATSVAAFADPTHRIFFTERTFHKLTPYGFRVVATEFHWMRRPYRGRFGPIVRLVDWLINRSVAAERFSTLIGGIYEIRGLLVKDEALVDESHADGARILT